MAFLALIMSSLVTHVAAWFHFSLKPLSSLLACRFFPIAQTLFPLIVLLWEFHEHLT